MCLVCLALFAYLIWLYSFRICASKGIRIKRLCVIINPLCNGNMPQECRGCSPSPNACPKVQAHIPPASAAISFFFFCWAKNKWKNCNMQHATCHIFSKDTWLSAATCEREEGRGERAWASITRELQLALFLAVLTAFLLHFCEGFREGVWGGAEIEAQGSGLRASLVRVGATYFFFCCSADIWRCQLIRQNKSQQASVASLAAGASGVEWTAAGIVGEGAWLLLV